MSMLSINVNHQAVTFPEGKPCIVTWKSKNKNRPGRSTGIGWIRRGEKPHSFEIIHSCFETWDEVEREYPARWTVWESQIISVIPLGPRG